MTDVWGTLPARPLSGPPLVPLGLFQPPTFLHHAHSQALLEAAELAAVSPPLVHRAVLVSQADVLGIFLYSALEWGGGTRNKLSEWRVGVGGAQGRGPSRSYCHHKQKRSLFTAIFLTFGWQGREIWRGGGEEEKKSWGHWGRVPPQEEDPRTQDKGLGAPQQARHPSFLTGLRLPAPSPEQTPEGRGGGWG